MSKQDRQGVRQASDLEQKYQFGKTFAEIMGIATDAQKVALEAEGSVKNLDHDTVFNALTKNGELQGLYRGDDGDLYVNASYMATGVLASKDGGIKIDMENGVGNLARGTAARFSDYGGGDILADIKAFLTAELEEMQVDTIRDFAIRVDSEDIYADGAMVSLHKFVDTNAEPMATARFEWADGSVSNMTGIKEGANADWFWEDMVWTAKDLAPKLLWSNESPGASFAPQTITLDAEAANFNALRIMWRHSTGLGYVMPSIITRELTTRISLGHFMSGTIGTNTIAETWRYALWGDDATALVFYGGMRSGTADNTAAIPVAVYGIRM